MLAVPHPTGSVPKRPQIILSSVSAPLCMAPESVLWWEEGCRWVGVGVGVHVDRVWLGTVMENGEHRARGTTVCGQC